MVYLLNAKAHEWTAASERRSPRNLLDLPLDVLKEIVKEVTHTNDLTSLALCHSTLHDLAIPHIYSRFDIVWPDTTSHVEPRAGVDALTYGLATLVFSEDLFGEATYPQQAIKTFNCVYCGNCASEAPSSMSSIPQALPTARKRRRGNHYAQYIRKFSLGNGPTEWVQEYLISKEGGKMLGTLVAVAVARMHNLETFVWDMPTGILRDVWMALASLGDRGENECKLERIWIRWHDNSQTGSSTSIPPVSTPPNVGLPPPNIQLSGTGHLQTPVNNGSQSTMDPGHPHIEQPTFSILFPLKSLSVLDIDELPYLEEMSILIGKSRRRIRELRVGIASHAYDRHWIVVRDGESPSQPTALGNGIRYDPEIEQRRGGVLGVLFSRIYDIQCESILRTTPAPALNRVSSIETKATIAPILNTESQNSLNFAFHKTEYDEEDPIASSSESSTYITASPNSSPRKVPLAHFVEDLPSSVIEIGEGTTTSSKEAREDSRTERQIPLTSKMLYDPADPNEFPRDSKISQKAISDVHGDVREAQLLSLNILELERIPISVAILRNVLDWSMLTELTILDCPNCEQLWRTLSHAFTPLEGSGRTKLCMKSSRRTHEKLSEYPLKLRKLHTNVVSSSLISFLKASLAPNSLEILFLQDCRANAANVNIDAIFRGPLRRHRSSLRKLSIDSSEKATDGLPITNSRWRRWILNRDIINFICSGRMRNLRELGMAIQYRDWHYFLQRLPQIPHIRSLYIPFIADHAYGNNTNSRELALQIVDIVTLCPEIELCYMGIGSKCFEILEKKVKTHLYFDGIRLDPSDVANDLSDEEQDNDANHELDDLVGEAPNDHEGIEDGSFDSRYDSEDVEDDCSEYIKPTVRLKLREILFYDDKIAIFKARHVKL